MKSNKNISVLSVVVASLVIVACSDTSSDTSTVKSEVTSATPSKKQFEGIASTEKRVTDLKPGEVPDAIHFSELQKKKNKLLELNSNFAHAETQGLNVPQSMIDQKAQLENEIQALQLKLKK